MEESENKIAVILPAYKSSQKIISVIQEIPSFIKLIIIVDDNCPEKTGNVVEQYIRQNSGEIKSPEINVIFLPKNLGVGGATKAGFDLAIRKNATVLVKMDSDGQMNPTLIAQLVEPLMLKRADYVKGNRFTRIEHLREMPKLRIFGNAALTFLTRLSSGFWTVSDPTNGFIAISKDSLQDVQITKTSNRWLFETDLLYRLRINGKRVEEIPMKARYSTEVSNLKEFSVIHQFLLGNIRNFLKRFIYMYYVRGMSIGSISLPSGLILFTTGAVFWGQEFISNSRSGVETNAGSIGLGLALLILGSQNIFSFFYEDMYSQYKLDK